MKHLDLTEENLLEFMNSKAPYSVLTIYGPLGSGKTYSVKHTLAENSISFQEVIFEDYLSMSFYEMLCETEDIYTHFLIKKYSNVIGSNQVLWLKNIELCTQDFIYAFVRLLKYYKSKGAYVSVILEYNGIELPQNELTQLSTHYCKIELKNREYIKQLLATMFEEAPSNTMLFEKLLNISENNLHSLYLAINILCCLDVIVMSENKYRYKETSSNVPNSILELYTILYEKSAESLKSILVFAAPFSDYIFEDLIKKIFSLHYTVDTSMDTHVLDTAMLKEKNRSHETEIFEANYIFSNKVARQVVNINQKEADIKNSLLAYSKYFDTIYQNKTYYNTLPLHEKIYLLANLIFINRHSSGINQIAHVVDLMEFNYKKYLYYGVIEYAEAFLNKCTLNYHQIYKQNYDFWKIYLNSLLALQLHNTIYNYIELSQYPDLSHFFATAYYNDGNVQQAFQLLNSQIDENTTTKLGYVYALLASCYDWMGNNKKAKYYFKQALKHCEKHDDLKHDLLKKYSMFIDFRIPECQNKMLKAVQYFQTKNLRNYGECLHNYGTECIYIGNYHDAKKYLENSFALLDKLCSSDIYHVLNSLGILYSFENGQYQKSIDFFKQALKYDNIIEFCNIAIHNNLYNIYIEMDDIMNARQTKVKIQILFQTYTTDLKTIKTIRPDLQHPLCQYYYNCALLSLKEGDESKALSYLRDAKESSSYQCRIGDIIDTHIKWLTKPSQGIFNMIGVMKKINKGKDVEKKQNYLCPIMFWG
ncbi:MAG: hypothetical protein R3Y24_09185 [Eubacteriales bacterium]